MRKINVEPPNSDKTTEEIKQQIIQEHLQSFEEAEPWLPFMLIGGILLTGLSIIVGFVIKAIQIDYAAGYPPANGDFLGYMTFGLLAASVIVTVIAGWIRKNKEAKRPLFTNIQRLLLLMYVGGFATGAYAANKMKAKHIADQKETDLTNCQHILGKHMTPQVQESCRIHSRDCRRGIDCDELLPQVQLANMKRWPKQYKRPDSSCQTARLLCLIPKVKK